MKLVKNNIVFSKIIHCVTEPHKIHVDNVVLLNTTIRTALP